MTKVINLRDTGGKLPEGAVLDAGALEARLLRYANLDPENQHWVGGDCSGGGSFCRACCEALIAQLRVDRWLSFINGKRSEQPQDEDVWVDGGYDWQESDGSEFCQRCGALLTYVLTDFGVNAELDHFESVRFRSPLDASDAYAVARIVAAAPEDLRALRLARRALKHCHGDVLLELANRVSP